jgi:hypothetical protein
MALSRAAVRLGTVALALANGASAATGLASAATVGKPGSIHGTVLRCYEPSGAVVYTTQPKPTEAGCTTLFSYTASPNGGQRPGLGDFRELVHTSNPSVFYSAVRMHIDGNPRSLWVMLSYPSLQKAWAGGAPWTSVVARYTVDCVLNTLVIGQGATYAKRGGNLVPAGDTPSNAEREPVPGTVGDTILQGVCGLQTEP